MTKPVHSAWPNAAGLPFSMFGSAAAAPGDGPAGAAAGLAAGVDWMKSFFGKLPGGSALPGFLVPTIDVEELDKRIADLRAAESWLEVNLNLLRATIQGLEVQRHTIAAVQSWSAMADPEKRAAGPAAPSGGLPPGWPIPPAAGAPSERPAAAPAAPAASPAPSASPEPPADAAMSADAPSAPDASAPGPGGAPLVALAANNWLGFMQDQFNRVAQSALKAGDGSSSAPPAAAPAAAKRARPSSKVAARKRRAGT